MNPKSRRGFTLIEMMITVAIVGIMAGISVVGGRQMMATARVNSGAHTLAGTLNDITLRARSTRCGQLVVVTPMANMTGPTGFPLRRRAIVEVAKRNCGPYTAATMATLYRYQPASGSVNPDGDIVVTSQSIEEFVTVASTVNPDPLAIVNETTGAILVSINDTTGVALGYDSFGQLDGYFPIDNAGAAAGAWTAVTAATRVAFQFRELNVSTQRTVAVSRDGTVTLP